MFGVERDGREGDGESLCAKLTARARAELVGNARQLGRGDTCQEAVRSAAALRAANPVKQKPTRLLAVRVDGDRATAMVTNGGRPPDALRFVKEGGRWKLPTYGFAGRLVLGDG